MQNAKEASKNGYELRVDKSFFSCYPILVTEPWALDISMQPCVRGHLLSLVDP